MKSTHTRRQAGRRVPGIRDIASRLGVSIGTVDRALHDRPGINPKTRARVLAAASSLGYRPNLAARFLSSRRSLLIGVALPREIASFWDLVRDGVSTAARGAEPSGVRLVEHSYARLGDGEVEALEACLKEPLDGLVIAPGAPERLSSWMAEAHARGISVACVDTDAPGAPHLTTVWVDPVVSGALAGDLMGRFLGGEGRLLVATGFLSATEHSCKVLSLRRTLEEHWPGVELSGVIETHDDPEEAYRKCRQALIAGPRVDGVYVATANSLAILRALEEEGLSGQVTVITTDLFPELRPHLAEGRVAATLYQRPRTQGRIAFECLHSFLVEGKEPPRVVSLPPQIVMRSNLESFLAHIRPGSSREQGRHEPAPLPA